MAIDTQEDEAPASLKVTLPKSYGLGGLDLVMNKPEDFGHKDQTVEIYVQDGQFRHRFPELYYHIIFWILPPLGGFPRIPPPPAYYLAFSDVPNEIYLVGMDRGEFRYRVYDTNTQHELDAVTATWNIASGEYVPVSDGELEVWFLNIQATKPNNRLDIDAATSHE